MASAASRTSSSTLDSLNEAQCRAVCSEAATVAIMAGPGSGKTHTLTSRVAWLVDTLGYQPQNIIVATFTVKAAREMRERIRTALGGRRENRMVIGTFHSIARRYLAVYGNHIGLDQKFSIADDGDSRAIINRICKRLQLSIDPVQARAWISKRKAKGSEWKPTPLRRKRSGEAEAGARAFETCYREYQDHLERSNLLDYDDLLVRCVDLLQKRPACVSNVDAVLIDEYQDTNGIQYDLMRLFAQEKNQITIVGDPDQSIYGWRSAEVANLRKLFDDFPKTDQISLEENYRSSQSILDTALSVIQQDSNRFQKILRPVHGKGTRPTLRRLKTSADEARWIVSEIRRVQMMTGNMVNPEDFAILLRSASLSRQIESSLGKAGIPYRMVGGFKFYERAEIKIVLDYLRVIHQPNNNDALSRILNVPKRGVGEATIKSLVEEAEKSSQSLWTLLVNHCRGDRVAKTNIKKPVEQRISGDVIKLVLDIQKKIRQATDAAPYGLVDMIDEVLARVAFEKFLENTYREDHETRWANVQEFRALGGDFVRDSTVDADEQLPEIDGLGQTEDTDVLARFLANVSLASDAQNKGQGQESTPMVTISTIHAAKGLEWPVIFIPAAYNGSIPHIRSEDANEERRLLYVAMTRAKALLYLSCPLISNSYGGQSEVQLSSFLEPLTKSFSKIGPDLESHRLETMGRILGREAPTQKSIYDALPGGYSPNDDEFPADPTLNQTCRDMSLPWDESDREPLQRKRPRLEGPVAVSGSSGQPMWSRGYPTTMEQRDAFTMDSRPGFITAGAHQATLASTDHADATPRLQASKTPKMVPPVGQTTLLGFVKRGPEQTSSLKPIPSHADLHTPLVGVGRHACQNNSAVHSAPSRPPIEPELTRHRIGTSKATKHKPGLKQVEVSDSRVHYAQFSSSPPRPPSPDSQVEPVHGKLEVQENGRVVAPGNVASRPAASFHHTTFNKQKTFGIKRPSGLAAPRDEATALQKLRKPFRPLTMNRSS